MGQTISLELRDLKQAEVVTLSVPNLRLEGKVTVLTDGSLLIENPGVFIGQKPAYLKAPRRGSQLETTDESGLGYCHLLNRGLVSITEPSMDKYKVKDIVNLNVDGTVQSVDHHNSNVVYLICK